MANDVKKGFERFEEEMNKQLLEASDQEILEDAKEAGDDTEAYAARMREWLESANVEAGRARRERAKAELGKVSRRSVTVVEIPRRKSSLDRGAFQPDTLAARHGKKLSDRDREAMEDDASELYDDDAWPENKDDGDR